MYRKKYILLATAANTGLDRIYIRHCTKPSQQLHEESTNHPPFTDEKTEVDPPAQEVKPSAQGHIISVQTALNSGDGLEKGLLFPFLKVHPSLFHIYDFLHKQIIKKLLSN